MRRDIRHRGLDLEGDSTLLERVETVTAHAFGIH
jgi:hypothetical protein